MNETLFYVFGISLVVFALLVSLFGLRNEKRFPSGPLMRLTALVFVVLVGATTTFAVLNAQDEQEDRDAELAAEEQQPGGAPTGEEQTQGGRGNEKEAKVKGPGGTLTLAADKTAIAYDKNALSSKPGEVTIDFDNPALVEHDVAIEQDGTEIAKSNLVAEGTTSVSADLAPGDYTFYCTVPGHREAGMEGTLTVK
jgi:plastocyanin